MPQRKGEPVSQLSLSRKRLAAKMKLLCLFNQQLRGMLEVAVPQQSDPVS